MINNNYDDVIREIYLMKIGSVQKGTLICGREKEREKKERQY